MAPLADEVVGPAELLGAAPALRQVVAPLLEASGDELLGTLVWFVLRGTSRAAYLEQHQHDGAWCEEREEKLRSALGRPLSPYRGLRRIQRLHLAHWVGRVRHFAERAP